MSGAAEDPFSVLSNAWRDGRPIVPLFGAGFSAGTGIPLTAQMVDYLAKVQWHFSRVNKTDLTEPHETAAALLEKGWPEPHDLTAEILQESEQNQEILRRLNDQDKKKGNPPLPNATRARDVPQAVVARVLRELGLANDPNRWLVLLQRLCDGNQELKDLFFARLERGRRPATAHQLAAFLAGLMRWQLLLTTNFDTLLEQALRSQSLDPTIYEIPEQGRAPDPQLVRSHFALVKLHGGAFGRLMSENLNYSLRRADREHLLGYFPPNPLVLVLGYGGGDRRVMSLIEDLVHNEDDRPYPQYPLDGDTPRVLWIHRTTVPDSVERIRKRLDRCKGRLVPYPYRNGGRFLQELYCRLATSHPVSATYYRAFPHMPPRTPNSSAKPADPPGKPADPPDEPMAVFHGEQAGSGTSTALAKLVERLPHEIIWCDLETVATVDGFVTYLQNRFRRFDPDLPPFAFFQTDGHSLSVLQPDGDPRVEYIVRAMQRGRYVVAIDSLGEFGTSFYSYTDAPSPDSPELERIRKESDEIRKLLENLIERRNDFGESRLFIAHTYLQTDDSSTDARARNDWQSFVNKLREEAEKAQPDILFTEFSSPSAPADFIAQIGDPSLTGRSLAEIAEVLWDRWQKDEPRKSWALALAACFRRRRDLVVLRRLLFKVVCSREGVAKEYGDLEELFGAVGGFSVSDWETGVKHDDREEIDRFLAGLEPLLMRQEGGFYWMHRVVRDQVYRKVRDSVNEDALANVHDLIATYYYTDVFRPSNDPAALFEYVFQRLLSIASGKRKDRIHRLHDLTVVLKRERDHLLRDTHPGSLRRCILRCRDIALKDETKADGDDDLTRVRTELRRVLCELEAEACRQASLFSVCAEIRHRQVKDRLSLFLKQCGEETPEAKINTLGGELAAVHVLEVLRQLVEKILPMLQKQPGSAAEQFSPLFRLLDHLIEISVCQFALAKEEPEEERARELLRQVREVCGFALDEAGPLKNCLREMASQIHDVRVRCAFRLMEINLGSMSAWEKGPQRKPLLDEVIGEFTEGQRILQEYTGWQGRQYDHYVCFLNTLRARAAYLQHPRGEFALAYLFLDAARGAIRRPVRGSDLSALATILLHQAECLMLHADDELKASPGPSEMASAKVKLDRARTALKQGHTFLERGRPQVWAWTWLRVLEAQLEHEQLVWSFDNRTTETDALYDETLRKGLTAIRIGLDSCRPNKRREQELEVLWWQFFICFMLRPSRPAMAMAAEERDAWQRLNQETGLDAFYEKRSKKIEDIAGESDVPTPLTRKAILALEDRLLKLEGMPLFRPVHPPTEPDQSREKTAGATATGPGTHVEDRPD
jgi:hypothetical protein